MRILTLSVDDAVAVRERVGHDEVPVEVELDAERTVEARVEPVAAVARGAGELVVARARDDLGTVARARRLAGAGEGRDGAGVRVDDADLRVVAVGHEQ